MNCNSRWLSIIVVAGVFGCSNDTPPATVTPEAPDAPAAAPGDERPNILFIVADDLGFTDLGAFGSEIPTPNLDRLAYQGLRLTNLHNGRACQQTRAMLMSGRGVSSVMENNPNRADGQRDNNLTTRIAALPELMQDAGYSTYMTGKWDLGLSGEYTPAARGFDRSFVLLEASSSHFAETFWGDDTYYEEDGVAVPIDELPEDFYSTRAYTDKMLGFLRDHDGDNPWFAFMPYTAPHWPLQLPDDWLDRNAGEYDEGWDVLREERSARAASLGVIPEGATMENFEPVALPWSSFSVDEQARYSRAQEIYAGMVEYLDMSIGRVIDHLEESGQLDSTIIVFMSDHGASAAEHGVYTGRGPTGGGPAIPDTRDNSFENFGRPLSFIDHGLGFGEAASAPLKYFKGRMAEGGLRAAALIRYPSVITEPGIDDTFITAMDILPTFLDIAGREHPGAGTYRGREIMPIIGESFWPYLSGESGTVHDEDDAAGWSAGATGAIIRGNFKAINHGPPGGGMGMGMGMGPVPAWELYDISADPGERNDLAAANPELTAELIADWEANWQ
jgi:arylsulfatase